MSETFPSRIEASPAEKEVQLKELLAQLDRVHDFVRSNPDNPEIPDIAAVLRDALAEGAPEAAGEISDSPEEEVTEESALAQPEALGTPSEFSFEAARRQKAPLSKELVLDMVNENLRLPSGEKPLYMKSYFDYVPADAADKAFFSDHDAALSFRGQLTDFIIRELKVSSPSEEVPDLEKYKQSFFEELEAGQQDIRDYAKGREARKDLKDNPVPLGALEFEGFTVTTKDGKVGDVLNGVLPEVASNIYVQRELTDRFVHWSSGAYMEQKLAGNKPKMEEVIYLNPTPQEAVEVFSDVVKALESQGLTAKVKIYDRLSDSDLMQPYDVETDDYGVRADGIVLYVTKADEKRALDIVRDIRSRHEAALDGRATPLVAQEIATGVAVGDMPVDGEESLTSHRVMTLDYIASGVRSANETDPERQVDLFYQLWGAEARKRKINPDNIAFNL